MLSIKAYKRRLNFLKQSLGNIKRKLNQKSDTRDVLTKSTCSVKGFRGGYKFLSTFVL